MTLRSHLGRSVVDGHAGAFVQDLDAVDLHRGGGAQLRGSGQGDVEGQDLIGVPGLGGLLQPVDCGHGRGVQVADVGADGRQAGEAADQGGVEDRLLRQKDAGIGIELRTNFVDIGDEVATQLPDQIQKAVTVEVDPDEAAGDAALVTGEGIGE